MKTNTKKGFTLIEVMVVMAIIAVLATLIIGAVTLARRTANETVNRGNARTLQTAAEAYYAKNRSYPDVAGTNTPSFDQYAVAAGISAFTNAPTGCSGATAGGGTVTDGTGGYTITPYTYNCGASLGAGDQLVNQ